MTLLCVPIFVHDAAQARRDAILAAEAGADIIELRIDELTEPISLADIPLPCIVTNRPHWEGGRCELPDDQRIDILAKTAASGAAYVDIELQTLQKMPGVESKFDRPLIVSAHDFRGRPERLNNLLLEMSNSAATVRKLAWTARSIRDNLEAFELLMFRSRPTIALCMGEAGIISRILAKKFGAFLTFASLEASAATAPGQVSIADMKELYRWDAVGRDTKVFGVVGFPVAHSMSPAIHNAAFNHTSFDGVYVPFLVQPYYESFKAFMENYLLAIDLCGLSITIPHKENALRYLIEQGGEIEPLARSIGAVNTITVERDADGNIVKLRGRSTDYAAILDSITDALGITREALRGYRVAVIGAGGTGRTAVAALAHYGATVVVYNRTLDRAQAMASEFSDKSGKVVAAPMEKLCDSCCQIYINTTSLGMHPNADGSAFGNQPPKLSADTLVFDTVYNPPVTKLLRQAQEAGAKTISGVEMFVRQAAAQFQTWTGIDPPLQVMRNVVMDRLSH